MPGIYIHVPFCRKACHYCNFHFSTNLSLKQRMLDCMLEEIRLRKDYLSAKEIVSVYFGGGTPSVFSKEDLHSILSEINAHFDLEQCKEICLEANPDDLGPEYLEELKEIGINRLSIGVQSFFEEDLKWMNRSHSSEQATQCIMDARAAGFDSISIDLIFGSPSSSFEIWTRNLEIADSLGIDHISCYGLTVEPKTALQLMIEKGKTEAPRDEDYSEQFLKTLEFLISKGYEHYEISNYARNSNYAVHNTNYWKGVSYLGIGPSAHSFDGESRSWNISNNNKYMDLIEQGGDFNEHEDLNKKDRFNEYIMTGLRTKWGIDTERLKAMDPDYYSQIEDTLQGFLAQEKLMLRDNSVFLSTNGKLIANSIISDLFIL